MTNMLVLVALAVAAPKVDPAQPYTAARSKPVEYEIDFKAVVTAPQGTKLLRVWVPVPLDDKGQEITQSRWSSFPSGITPSFHAEPVFGNRFAYFEFANPQGAQIITHQFRAKVWQLDWNLRPEKVSRVDRWPDSFAPYRRSERGILIDERVRNLAAQLTADVRGPAAELTAVMSWVNRTLTYDHSTTSLVASAEHALTKKRGDCSDYHGLCSSLGRALGVPTRVVYGLHLFPKNLPCHCKLEAYLSPYGWVSFDVSETQRLVKNIQASTKLEAGEKKELVKAAIERLNQGFRDNTWLMHSKGTDYELAPKASRKVPLVATIYAEADGVPLPLPDPADPTKREFAWMTAHRYVANRKVVYPYLDWDTLRARPEQ